MPNWLGLTNTTQSPANIAQTQMQDQGMYSPNWGPLQQVNQGPTIAQPDPSLTHTDPLDFNQLLQLNLGNQDRSLSLAGRQAGAYAMSRGLDPNAFIQHAQGNVYDSYGSHIAQLPGLAFQSQLQANNQNFGQGFQLYHWLTQMQLERERMQMERDNSSQGFLGQLGSTLGGLAGSFIPGLGGLGGSRRQSGGMSGGGGGFQDYLDYG